MARNYFRKQRVDYFDQPHRRVTLSRQRYDVLVTESRLALLAARNAESPGSLCKSTGDPLTKEELSEILNVDPELVRNTINYLAEWGKIEQKTDGTYFILEVPESVTSETESAARKRKERKEKESATMSGQSHDNDATLSRYPETETETETDSSIPHLEIVCYLNERANRNYRSTTNSTRRLISARWREGFRLSDFQLAIDHQTSKWLGDEKMEEYLRPVTLFAASKFEGYVQAAIANGNDDPAASNWTCVCGKRNPEYATDCETCRAPRPEEVNE